MPEPALAAQRRLTLVTGGTRGIGAAVARRLAAEGHDLVLGYRDDEGAAEGLVAELTGGTGGRPVDCRAVRADVTRDDGIEALFAVAAEVGPLTGVVNNAGGIGHIGPLAETPTDVVRRVVDLNLTAAVLVARRAAQVLARPDGPGGAIVNISSGAATIGSPGEFVHYAAAKAGVDALTLGLSKELATLGVRVNSVAPGLVVTGLHADAGEPERPARIAPTIPMERAGEPTEIAEAVAWLLSDAASYVTGAVLRVAGGR